MSENPETIKKIKRTHGHVQDLKASDTETLKPCPFCGYSDAEVEIEKSEHFLSGKVSCNICGAAAYGLSVMIRGGKLDAVRDDFDESELLKMARQAWNVRHEPRTESSQ